MGSFEGIAPEVNVWYSFCSQEGFSHLFLSLLLFWKLAGLQFSLYLHWFYKSPPNCLLPQTSLFFKVLLGLNFSTLLKMKPVSLERDCRLSVLWPNALARPLGQVSGAVVETIINFCLRSVLCERGDGSLRSSWIASPVTGATTLQLGQGQVGPQYSQQCHIQHSPSTPMSGDWEP